MRFAITGALIGAVVAVVAYALHLATNGHLVNDPATVLYELRLAVAVGTAGGGWLGIIAAMLSPDGGEPDAEIDHPNASDGAAPDRLSA